jgi:hypothetical protein
MEKSSGGNAVIGRFNAIVVIGSFAEVTICHQFF